jgi:hypothetical protein
MYKIMANFKDSPKFDVHDDYYTPEWVWEKIKPLISTDKVIWEACMLNATRSQSMDIWKKWGYKVVGDRTWDVLNCQVPECDIIITNPPFDTEIKKNILKRLVQIDKPFIIIMNSTNTFSNYFHEIMDLNHTQIITPRQKLHFKKDGEEEKKQTSFYSVFVAYRMNLPNNKLFC